MSAYIIPEFETKTIVNSDMALHLASRGWKVFPCAPDKKPMTARGFKDATDDPEKIKTWAWPLIGVYCEGSGFFAVDVDRKNGVDGLDTWSKLVGNAAVNYGPSQRTPSGGIHYLFKLPAGLKVPNNAGKLGAGLDLRSTGYICTGSGYQWLHGPDTELTEPPDFLVEAIRRMTAKTPADYWLNHYLAEARPGNRNETGLALACQLRDSGIAESEARAVMAEYAARVPGTDYTESEAMSSLQSAYAGTPREPAIITGKQDERIKPTHDDLAARWLQQAPVTSYGRQEWRRYTGGVWPKVDEDTIKGEVLTILKEARIEGIKPSAAIVNSVTELARLQVCVSSDLWDANPDLLPCKNGVLHIPTMHLIPHSPANYFTFRTAYDYDPEAKAETWLRVLEAHDPATRDFLQEYAGLCLTTDNRYELALWFYGPKGCGKSTVIEGFRTMLGDRAGVLSLSRIENSRFALGDISGKTLLTATEQPAVYIQQSDIINTLISGESLKIEKKFKDEVDIRPVAKIIWAMNEFPRVPDSGNGLFRRVKVIEFPPIAEAERDERIKEAIKQEGSGILNWALAGLVRLRSRGRFAIPEKVRQASAAFEKLNNIPAAFVEEACLLGPNYKTQAGVLYTAYKDWCIDNGHKFQSSTSITQDWKNMGLEKYQANGRNFWRGIGVKNAGSD